MMPKVLLHVCCAPCTTFVYQWLQENGFDTSGFFYNPNIKPEVEYQKRRDTLHFYVKLKGLPLELCEAKEEIQSEDCEDCYRKRLEMTAHQAKVKGFHGFSTTLLISPYQKHDLLKGVAKEVSEEVGTPFFYEDFRKGYFESRRMAKEFGLYRQKYCGCEEGG